MNFENVCPQFVQIDADRMDIVDTQLCCPICGKPVTDGEGSILKELCDHVLYFGATEIDANQFGPSTGLAAIDYPLYFSNADELKREILEDIETEGVDGKLLGFYRTLSKNCVVYCYNHIENLHCGEMRVADCLAVRFPGKVPTIGDWIDAGKP